MSDLTWNPDYKDEFTYVVCQENGDDPVLIKTAKAAIKTSRETSRKAFALIDLLDSFREVEALREALESERQAHYSTMRKLRGAHAALDIYQGPNE